MLSEANSMVQPHVATAPAVQLATPAAPGPAAAGSGGSTKEVPPTSPRRGVLEVSTFTTLLQLPLICG